MATFYEIKETICKIFGMREIEISEDDVEVEFTSRHYYAREGCRFILKNEELLAIYNKVQEMSNDGLELFNSHQYEVAIDLDYPLWRGQEFALKSDDAENGISYEMSYISIEYFIFLLGLHIDKCKQNDMSRIILPTKMRRIQDYRFRPEDDKELDWKEIIIQGLGECSIKILSTNTKRIEWMRNKKAAYSFEYMFKSQRALQEYLTIEDIFPIRGVARNRVDITTLEILPHREYINDVVDYYKLAYASNDPYNKYISFYHVMEYFYDEVFKKKLVEELVDRITRPDFSYKNEDKVYEIATFVKNRIHMNDESGQGNELESLRFVLKEYVNIDELRRKIKEIDATLENYYQSTKVSFSKAPALSWNDSEGVYTLLAKRIYFTRNSLIHSKSGKNRERYKPYKDEKELQKEIPLMQVVAEMIIINSSRIV